jgi:hypothetical protein
VAELADPATLLVLLQAAAALGFLGALLRLGLLLGATPVGAMRQEILYVRGAVFRPLVRLLVVLLVLEAAELLLATLGWLAPGWAATQPSGGLATTPDALLLGINTVQALLLVILAVGTLRAFRPYSRRSLRGLEDLARQGVEGLARRMGPARVRKAGARRGP